MTTPTKQEYLVTVRARYKICQEREGKSSIINEVMNNLGVKRKSAIRSINKKVLVHRKTLHSRKVTYGYDLIKPLTFVWDVAGKPCSKRLHPQMGELIKQLEKFGEIHLYEDQEKLLVKMSTFTIDRLLEGERDLSKKEYGLSGTKRSPLLKTLIPIRTGFEDVTEPGHLEMDCVLHCGESMSGQYAETLNVLDIHSHWNEKTIFLNKTKEKVVGSFHQLRKQFPFPILSIDFDNGFEFVNWVMHKYCKREGLSFTRSRSYHKNDQAHIEGKNYQSIRKVVGYDRITDPVLVDMIDDLYQHEHRLLTNFFYTTMKLEGKKRVGGRVCKTHGEARTPYQRVLASDTISQEIKDHLTEQYKGLNPAELQRSMKKKLKAIQARSSVTKLNLATTPP